MRLRRNLGIALMLAGVILTINQFNQGSELFDQITKALELYWPLLLSFVGIYIVSTPRRRR